MILKYAFFSAHHVNVLLMHARVAVVRKAILRLEFLLVPCIVPGPLSLRCLNVCIQASNN